MNDMEGTARPHWIDPLGCFEPEAPAREVAIDPHVPPQAPWDETTRFTPAMHKVGRLRHYYEWSGHGGRLWQRTRYWPTRRRVLNIAGDYNPKTMRREKTILDKRPVWWALAFAALLVLPWATPSGVWNTAMTAAACSASSRSSATGATRRASAARPEQRRVERCFLKRRPRRPTRTKSITAASTRCSATS